MDLKLSRLVILAQALDGLTLTEFLQNQLNELSPIIKNSLR
jgi:hypothetical protein